MTKNSLTEIIESLTANEKRNFYLTHSGSKEPNYFQVYKVLEKNAKIGNLQVQKMVRNKKMNVSYEKAYLQKMLARSLRNFYEDKTAEITLHQNLIDIEILYNKNLLKSCLEIIENSKIQAASHEVFLTSLKLLHWEIKCRAQIGNFAELGRFIERKTKAEAELHAKQADYEIAVRNNATIGVYFMKQGLSKSPNNSIKIPLGLKKLIGGVRNAKSFIAFLQYSESLVLYYSTMGKIREALLVSRNVMKRFDTNSEFKYRFTSGYVAYLGNICHLELLQNALENANKRIIEYQSILTNHKMNVPEPARKEIALSSKMLRFDLYAKKDDFLTTLPASLEDAENFEAIADALREDLAVSFSIMTINSLMLNGYPEKALGVINYSLKRFREHTRLDIYFCFQILYLLSQFDVKNYTVLPSLIKGVLRFFNNRKLQIKAPYLIIKMLNELLLLPSKKHPATYELYLNKLSMLSSNIEEDFFLGSSKVLYWIKSKIK